jgi:hypothetical protein
VTSVRAAAVALLFLPAIAPAQAPSLETGRALLQRQQQSDQFSLQLRQSQSLLGAPAAERRSLDARYLEQRQSQEQLHDAQLRRVTQEPAAVRAGAAERFERERRAQDLGFETPPRQGRPDPDAGVRWTPTLEDRSPDGVSWTPTLEKRRP